jgi:ATP-dependent DNA ligase
MALGSGADKARIASAASEPGADFGSLGDAAPPIEPMLARLASDLPQTDGYLFEPKWDGFRAIVIRSARAVLIQSRDLRPFDRYFPELHDAFLRLLPTNSVIDGEIVIASEDGLDFDALQLRLHPAASRVAALSKASPASFVAFDVLCRNRRSFMRRPQRERRLALEEMFAAARPPILLTPATADPALARQWLHRFEGAGLDGVVAKPCDGLYEPGRRAMLKVKHERTAECVVAGFRWHKSGEGVVGSLLLGLYDARDVLHHVGVTSAFTMKRRRELAQELAPLRRGALERHPWLDAEASSAGLQRVPGKASRWSATKDLSWIPLRIERVCEVKYDHLQGDRFRHAAIFVRWRKDKSPQQCRYDQLETVTPYELKKVFAETQRVRSRG